MRIPTLFLRDPRTLRVRPEVRPGCEWVLDGEGQATRMYDGIGLLFDGAGWYLSGSRSASGQESWRAVGEDGRLMSWIAEGLGEAQTLIPGTYELCGPDIVGNPEGFAERVLIRHQGLPGLDNVPRSYDSLSDFLRSWPHEGVVWHHPAGKMAKLRSTDFPT